MFKDLDELRGYPFVVDLINIKFTKGKLKEFVNNLKEFLNDGDFREKLGFEKRRYTLKEGMILVRVLVEKYQPSKNPCLRAARAFASYVVKNGIKYKKVL